MKTFEFDEERYELKDLFYERFINTMEIEGNTFYTLDVKEVLNFIKEKNNFKNPCRLNKDFYLSVDGKSILVSVEYKEIIVSPYETTYSFIIGIDNNKEFYCKNVGV